MLHCPTRGCWVDSGCWDVHWEPQNELNCHVEPGWHGVPCGFLFAGTVMADVGESEDHGKGKLSLAPQAELAVDVVCAAHAKC